ncbi:hypothetical protein JKP88DRAFT_243950 [Tribonema minus]|uniref:DNA primase/polymerase bifunctional N-terminal domain-containing protein n=1 Tax=Tribonema minus TaxID=303371 RepID=A0A835Z5M9_9STRA|nr:hypothetical protein JKP88DRAFT_243950 [Tribonema minus]
MLWDTLRDWLVATYPDDLLMPVPKGEKCPKFPHANGRWSWHMYNKFAASHRENDFDIAILLRTLCVVDVDTKELVEDLEQRFPVLKTSPSEDTKKGRHYFFSRSELCDAQGFMDQRSSVIPNVDFKTRCTTGTAGIILVAPSTGKTWVRTPWMAGDVLNAIPDDLLRAVALPTRQMASVKLIFADGAELAYTNNPHLQKFDLLRNLLEGEEYAEVRTEVPIAVGTAQQFEDLMHMCQHRRFQRWPTDIEGVRHLADYLCATQKVMNMLDTGNPVSPSAWLQAIDNASPGWGQAFLSEALVDITDGYQIRYQRIVKDDQWLFHEYPHSSVQGSTVLSNDLQTQILGLPSIVRSVLERHPDLVLAGSSVLHMACTRVLGEPSDYDMYYIGTELRHILSDIKDHVNPDVMHRTGAAMTYVVDDVTIQIILRRYRDVGHVLNTFDLAPSQCALYKGRVLVTQSWLFSVRHMAAYVNFWHWNSASVSRVFKYYSKGFEILVPALRRDMLKPYTPCPGAHNLLAVEAAPQTWPWSWKLKRSRDGKPKRIDAIMLRKMVRDTNYWGLRHQSGYSEFISDALPYVMRAMICRGMSWLGLRPVRTRTQCAQNLDSIEIPEATDVPFHMASPNFPQLYDLRK